jgi:ABC-type transport system involved in multi-copper enzyme maturation permease subunit
VTRLTWRQFRTEAVIGAIVLAVLAVVLVITGVNLAQVNDTFQATCMASGSCAASANPVLGIDQGLQTLVQLIATLAPAVIGLFFGAPLIARELETGTFRLAWTQSVTLRRWFAVKLGVVGLAAVAAGGLLTWLVDWWQTPLDAATQNSFDPTNFGIHGLVPIGYAAFAFALGVMAGILLRRTIAAMGLTLVGFVVARIAVTSWVRPNLASPLHESLPFVTARPGFDLDASTGTISLTPPHVYIPNGWVYSTQVVDNSGHTLTGQYVLQACPALGQLHSAGPAAQPLAALQACQSTLSATFQTVVTYQPAGRFWPFQLAELGIFVAAALALGALGYWWLRRQYA